MSELNGGQRAVMALVVPLVWAFGYAIYRVGKREMNGENNEYARWGVWYWLVAGCVCGKWLFHVIPNATLHTIIGPSEYHVSGVLSFGILLGLIAMVIFQEVTRVWHGNPNYEASTMVESQEDMLDKKNMTQRTNVLLESTHDFGSDYMNGIDKVKDQVKRQRIASILLVCMFYLSGIEGLFTCFWQDKSLASTWTLVIMTWLMRLMDSVIVYCSMIHGMFHTQDPDEPQRWTDIVFSYGACSFYWGVAMLLSMVPIFTGMNPDTAEDIITYKNLMALSNGVCAGILIWFWAYFMFMQSRDMSLHKRYIKWQLIAFISGSGLQGIVALFV